VQKIFCTALHKSRLKLKSGLTACQNKFGGVKNRGWMKKVTSETAEK
jgi:hypothetical protein